MDKSVEYHTLKSLKSQLIIGFKSNIYDLATQFFSKGLIDDECYELVMSTRSILSDFEKAELMLKSIMDQTMMWSKYYYDAMIHILSQSNIHQPLVELLKDEYTKQENFKQTGKQLQPAPTVPTVGVNNSTDTQQVVQPAPTVPTGDAVWTKKTRMHLLTLIRYYEPQSGEEQLRILDEIAPFWREIGEMIGFSPAEISAIQSPGVGKTVRQCIQEIITKWQMNAKNLPNSHRYPNNWFGVSNLLMDSLNSEAAHSLIAAVNASCSDLHGNYDRGVAVWTKQAEMPLLNLIRYCDSHGEKKELRILDVIGKKNGISTAEIEAVQQTRDDNQCIQEIITKWSKKAEVLPNCRHYPNNWFGIYNLLTNSSNLEAAHRLIAAIDANCSDLHGNYDRGVAVWTKQVEMPLLNLIRYHDDSHGDEKMLMILTVMAPIWQEIGKKIGFSTTEIEAVQQTGDDYQCIQEIIKVWPKKAEVLPDCHHYPYNWFGVYNLLTDSSNLEAAHRLMAAIDAKCSNLHDSCVRVVHVEPKKEDENQPQPKKEDESQPQSKKEDESQPQSKKKDESQPQMQQTQSLAISRRRTKMTKYKLAEWLEEQGIDEQDVDLLKGNGVNENLFMKLTDGDSYLKGLSETFMMVLKDLQDLLRYS